MREKILLLGSGGHSHSVIDVIEQEGKYSIVGIIDNEKSIGERVLGYEVIGCDSELEELRKSYKYAFIAVGYVKSPIIRIKLFEMLKSMNFIIPSIISPFAYVSKHAYIDEGTIIMHQALVNVNAKIGKNCIINTKSLIEHDAVIEDNSHISTSSVINGGVIIKENTFFGSNATSREYIEISNFVKAGSVVK